MYYLENNEIKSISTQKNIFKLHKMYTIKKDMYLVLRELVTSPNSYIRHNIGIYRAKYGVFLEGEFCNRYTGQLINLGTKLFPSVGSNGNLMFRIDEKGCDVNKFLEKTQSNYYIWGQYHYDFFRINRISEEDPIPVMDNTFLKIQKNTFLKFTPGGSDFFLYTKKELVDCKYGYVQGSNNYNDEVVVSISRKNLKNYTFPTERARKIVLSYHERVI